MRQYRHLILLLLATVAFSFISCSKYDMPEGKGRVVLIYMSGNNSLNNVSNQNFQSLYNGYIPSEKSTNILLVMMHNKENANSPKLLRLYKKDDGSVIDDIVATYNGRSSTDPAFLNEIMLKIKSVFNAEDCGVIFWSHATGWLPPNKYKTRSTYLLDKINDPYAHMVKSFGDNNGKEMDLIEMANALPYKLSFAIFDCCFMGGIEVVYQFRNKADYIMAAPTEILASGFPYDKIMKPLFKTEPDLESVGESFYNYYNSQSTELYRSATLSLYKLSELDPLANKCKEIFAAHKSKIKGLNTEKIQKYFRYNDKYFYDLGDFIKQLNEPDYATFSELLAKVVIKKWHTPKFLDIEIKSYSGISTYIPISSDLNLENYYRLLIWDKQVGII